MDKRNQIREIVVSAYSTVAKKILFVFLHFRKFACSQKSTKSNFLSFQTMATTGTNRRGLEVKAVLLPSPERLTFKQNSSISDTKTHFKLFHDFGDGGCSLIFLRKYQVTPRPPPPRKKYLYASARS